MAQSLASSVRLKIRSLEKGIMRKMNGPFCADDVSRHCGSSACPHTLPEPHTGALSPTSSLFNLGVGLGHHCDNDVHHLSGWSAQATDQRTDSQEILQDGTSPSAHSPAILTPELPLLLLRSTHIHACPTDRSTILALSVSC